MPKGPSYNVPYRRRREGKTDYRLRKRLIISGLPRLVARRTRNHTIVQLVKPTVKGDEIIASAHSSELRKKYGWLGGLGNLPASYLTGLLCGHRSAAMGVDKAFLDMGLQAPSHGSRVFAVLKGFLDAGIEVPCDEEILPDEPRITGEHIAKYAEELSSNPDAHSRIFSGYLSRGLPPQKIMDHFSSVREKIKANSEGSKEEQ